MGGDELHKKDDKGGADHRCHGIPQRKIWGARTEKGEKAESHPGGDDEGESEKQGKEDIEAAKKDFSRFVRKIKAKYRQAGEELKWIRNIERGSKGGWHVHMIMSAPKKNSEDMLKQIQNEWSCHGRVFNEFLNSAIKPEDGPFRRLAEYVAKSGGVKAKEGSTPKETSFSASRNLITPISKTELRPYRTWRKKPKAPKGYHVLEKSVRQITNPLTGCPCREFVMIRDGYESKLIC